MNNFFDPERDGKPIISLNQFCKNIGISPTTAWRWRKRGWLKTVNIAGRPYVTSRAVAEFMARAERGEFSQPAKAPGRKR